MAKTCSQLIGDFKGTLSLDALELSIMHFDMTLLLHPAGSVEEIIEAFMKENNINPSDLQFGPSGDDTLRNQTINRICSGIMNIKIMQKEIADFILPCNSDEQFMENMESMSRFYGDHVIMIKPACEQEVTGPDGKKIKQQKNAESFYGTDEGDRRIKNQEHFNKAYKNQFKDQFERTISKDDKERNQKSVDKRYAQINKILGLKPGNKTKFKGPETILDMQDNLTSKFGEMTSKNARIKVIEDFHINYLKMIMHPDHHSGLAEDLAYGGKNFENDFSLLAAQIREMTNTQATKIVFNLMETENTVSELPDDHADLLIRGGQLSIAPNRKEQEIDRKIHNIVIQSKSAQTGAAGFNFNAKVADKRLDQSKLPPGFNRDQAPTVGDLLQDAVRQIATEKAKALIQERRKHKIASIVDVDKTKEVLDVSLDRIKMDKNYPKISKPPYRAMAKLMEPMKVLAEMMCKSFQKMFASSAFYNAESQSDFERRIGVNQNYDEQEKNLTGFLDSLGQDDLVLLCKALKAHNESAAKAKNNKKKGNKKDDDKTEEVVNLTAEEFTEYVNDLKGMTKEDPKIEILNAVIQKSGLKRKYESFKEEKMKENWKKEQKEAREQEDKQKEKERTLHTAQDLARTNPDIAEILDKLENLDPSDANFTREHERLYLELKMKVAVRSGKNMSRDEVKQSIKDKCADAKTPGDFVNLCKSFQLHDALRVAVINEIDMKNADDQAKPLLLHDANMIDKRRQTLIHWAGKMYDVHASHGKIHGEEGALDHMHSVFSTALIGSGEHGNPPRGLVENSGADTVHPNPCFFSIIKDLETIANLKDRRFGLVKPGGVPAPDKENSKRILKAALQQGGFENVDIDKLDIRGLIAKLKVSVKKDEKGNLLHDFDANLFMKTLQEDLIDDRQRQNSGATKPPPGTTKP